MFSLVFLSSLVFSSFGNVCIWNRYGDQLNIYLNGNYEDSDLTFNNHPVYVRNNSNSDGSCGSEVSYMFYSNDKWRVKSELNDSAGTSAKCDYDQDIGSNPWDCEDWYFPSNVDDEVTVSDSNCPVEICDSIDFTLEGSDCDDLVFSKLGDNKYINSNNKYGFDLYLYFNPESFRWVCDNNIDHIGCFSAYGWTEETTANQNPWIGFSNSNLQATQVWNNGNTATFVCNTNGNDQSNPTTTTTPPQTTTTTTTTTTSSPQTTNPTTTTNNPTTTTQSVDIDNVSPLCFWNIWNSTNKFLNGKYDYDGILNSHNVYVSTSHSCDTVYTSYLVYSIYNKWFISDEKVTSGTFRAICEENNTDNPSDCTKWEIPSAVDRDATLSLGTCPTVPCDSIEFTLDDPTSQCHGLTLGKHGDSGLAYYNSDANRFLHFNTDYFRWVCDNDLNTTCLKAYSWSDNEISNPWIDFSIISAVSKPWKDDLTATFKCNNPENPDKTCCIHKTSFPSSELDCRSRTETVECRSNSDCKWCSESSGCARASNEC